MVYSLVPYFGWEAPSLVMSGIQECSALTRVACVRQVTLAQCVRNGVVRWEHAASRAWEMMPCAARAPWAARGTIAVFELTQLTPLGGRRLQRFQVSTIGCAASLMEMPPGACASCRQGRVSGSSSPAVRMQSFLVTRVLLTPRLQRLEILVPSMLSATHLNVWQMESPSLHWGQPHMHGSSRAKNSSVKQLQHYAPRRSTR